MSFGVRASVVCFALLLGFFFVSNTAQATTRTLHPLRSPSFSNPIVLQSATILKAGEAYTLAYCAIRGFFGTSCTQSHTPQPEERYALLPTIEKHTPVSLPAPQPTVIKQITVVNESAPAPQVAGASTDAWDKLYTTLSLFYRQTRSNHEDQNDDLNDAANDLQNDITDLQNSLTDALETGSLSVSGAATFQGSVTLAALGGGVLLSDANGTIATSTLSGMHITADAFDFTELSDALTLDAPTTIDLNAQTLSFENGTTSISTLAADTLSASTAALGTTTIAGNLTPTQNNTYNLGSPSNFFGDAYIDTLSVNNLAAASSSVSGSASDTFTFNTDNASNDAEDITLIFFRGVATPNALLTWDATDNRFETNQPVQIAPANIPNTPIFSVYDQAGASLFEISSSTTTFNNNLALSGSIIPSADITYDLGSPTKQWRDVYIGPGSLYINGQKVLEDVSDTITLSADTDQGLMMEASGIGTITARATGTGNANVFSNSGNINITSTSGNINLGTSGTGQLNLGTVTTGVWQGSVIDGAYIDPDFVLNSEADTSAEIAGFLTDETGTGSVVFSASPTFTGTVQAAAATLSSTLTLSGTAANIALGSNYLSGDGDDEGVFVDGGGNVGVGVTTLDDKLEVQGNIAVPNSSAFKVGGVGDTFIGQLGSSAGVLELEADGTRDIQFGGATGGTAMFIDTSTGNVGIGTTSPGSKLHLVTQGGTYTNNRIIFEDSSALRQNWIGMDSDADNLVIAADEDNIGSDSSLKFRVDAAEVMRVTGGNVGIGTTNPSQKLDVEGIVVAGDASATMGPLAFAIQYSGDDFINTIGSQYSSGATALGYAVRAKSGASGYVSSADNTAWSRGVLEISSELVFKSAASALVTNGTDVVLTERFRIDANGDVGIGTTNPDQKLVVDGAVAFKYDADSSHNGIKRNGLATEYYNGITSTASSVIHNFTGSSDVSKMVITEGGDIGIGTTNPNYSLQVHDGVSSADLQLTNTNTGSTTSDGLFLSMESGGINAYLINKENGDLRFRTNNSDRLTIDENGNVGIGATNPSDKLQIAGATDLLHIYSSGVINSSTINAPTIASPKNTVTLFVGSGSSGIESTLAYTANESSGNVRFNGSDVAWGDFGYYPTGGDAGEYGHFRFSVTGNTIDTIPDAKVGVGSLSSVQAIEILTEGPLLTSAIASEDQWELYRNTSADLFGFFNRTESQYRLVLADNGNTGIGTNMTSPNNALHVGGNIGATGWIGAGCESSCSDVATGYVIIYDVGNINYTGTITDVSDRRLKENIHEIDGNLAKLLTLEPVSFTMKNDASSTPQLGFIAQDVMEVFSEPISVMPEQSADGEEFYGLDYTQLIAPTIGSIIEMHTDLSTLLETGTVASSSTFAAAVAAEGSVWSKLVELAHSFVDGVLTITGAEVEYVRTNKLCIGQTCITEEKLIELLEEEGVDPADDEQEDLSTDGDSYNLSGDTASSTQSTTQNATSSPTTATSTPTDTTAPVITLNGDSTITLTVGDSYTEEGATAEDETDGDISSSIVTDDAALDTTTPGTYTVTYTATDSAGNTATKTRTVIVEAPTPPPTENPPAGDTASTTEAV